MMHVDLVRVRLDQAIQATVPIVLVGAEDAPGVIEGGVVEHITHTVTVEALPTSVPESISHDVSGMSIGDTLLLSAIEAPDGVTLLGELDEIVVATLTPPRLRIDEDEIELETELVGEGGAEGSAEDADESDRGAVRRRRRVAAAPLARSLGRLARRRARQPRPRVRGHAPQRRIRRRRRAGRAAGGSRAPASVIADGCARAGRAPGGPRVALLEPLTWMNESGRSVGPARGAMRLPLDRVLVVHDEIDLPFGEVRARLGGGLAGHNGLKSLRRELGAPDFWRVRVGVGRPESTDPEIVAAYVLQRFREPAAEVAELIGAAADAADGVLATP